MVKYIINTVYAVEKNVQRSKLCVVKCMVQINTVMLIVAGVRHTDNNEILYNTIKII